MIIAYNKPITFGRHGTAKDLQCTGIDFSEDGNHSWTKAPVAEFAIQLPVARQEVLLQLEAAPFIIPESVTAQKVFVFVGGLFTGYAVSRNQKSEPSRSIAMPCQEEPCNSLW